MLRSAFVADVDVRSQIDRTIRSAAPRVQMVADGSGAHRIGVGQFSWECFRKYPDWGMTIRLTLSASPSSIGAGGEVSGERTVFGPGAPECFTIECAAQKHRREFNPLVEGLAGELASKLVAQLQPTAPPAGVAITPAQFAQAPSGNAGREPGSVPGGTPSAGVGATGQGGGSGRLDSSTLGASIRAHIGATASVGRAEEIAQTRSAWSPFLPRPMPVPKWSTIRISMNALRGTTAPTTNWPDCTPQIGRADATHRFPYREFSTRWCSIAGFRFEVPMPRAERKVKEPAIPSSPDGRTRDAIGGRIRFTSSTLARPSGAFSTSVHIDDRVDIEPIPPS